MFIEDIKSDFYDVLLGNRVLLLVHYDVDAVCTCKILQDLFKCDNISYTLVPVGSISELKTAYEENNEEVKYVVLVNCGGTIDLVDILQPEEDVVFFVLDSHKPTDICNVYSDGQVRLVYKDSEENIPNFDDIFRDDEDDEDEEQGSGMEALEAVVEKRRARRAWEERRHTLMFNYTQFSYYGKPSACVALELAWRASRGGPAAQWAAGVALAAQQALHTRAPAAALLDAHDLHRRLAAPHHQSCRVVLEKDVWLPLYRSWSLEAALRHAPDLAPHLRLHTVAGEGRVRQLLADMGYPLAQARQAYRAMDVELRRGLRPALEAAASRRALPPPSRPACLLKRDLQPISAALDLVYVVMALIEHVLEQLTPLLLMMFHGLLCSSAKVESLPRGEGFQRALAALALHDEADSVALGAAAAKQALAGAATLAHQALAARRLHLAGPFSYFFVQEGTPEARWARGPLWLGLAARWAAAAAARAGAARPLLASAPLSDTTCILLGVPPNYDQEPRNLFGAAFAQAATKCGAAVSLQYMDSSVLALPLAQRTQFLDALTALLA